MHSIARTTARAHRGGFGAIRTGRLQGGCPMELDDLGLFTMMPCIASPLLLFIPPHPFVSNTLPSKPTRASSSSRSFLHIRSFHSPAADFPDAPFVLKLFASNRACPWTEFWTVDVDPRAHPPCIAITMLRPSGSWRSLHPPLRHSGDYPVRHPSWSRERIPLSAPASCRTTSTPLWAGMVLAST